MRARGLPLAALVAAGPALAAEEIAVPSGPPITFVEAIQGVPGPEGLTLRFRFLAPAIAREGGTVDAEAAFADMQALCDGYALPRIASGGPRPAQIVISLMDRDVPFGAPAPEATQFFEAFRPDGDACTWEPF